MKEEALPKAWESLISSAGFVPVIVKSIERVHDTSWSMEPNRHEHFEMVYMKKGSAVFEISRQPVPLEPNDIVIIKPQQEHKFIVKSESGCEFIVLSFRFVRKSDAGYAEASLEDFLNFVSNREAGAFIKLKVSQKNEIIVLLNSIVRERQSEDIGSDFLSQLMVMELFVYISRALKMEWENSIKSRSPKIKQLIQVSVNYIHNHFERDLSLAEISKFVFLSPSYFTRAFKEEMGMSPISYLLKVRVDRAKELLSESDMKISEIALNIGFSNQQRFNEIFKKHTHMTPMQFRKAEEKHSGF